MDWMWDKFSSKTVVITPYKKIVLLKIDNRYRKGWNKKKLVVLYNYIWKETNLC